MRRTWVRRILWALGTALVLAGGAAVTLWWLSWAPPRWYHPPDADDPAANELAEAVEQRLAEELHLIRADEEPWRIRIREEQVNAWLATRLRKWLEHERGAQWPDQLGTPQVRLDVGHISVAVPLAADVERSDARSDAVLQAGRTLTVSLRPTVEGDDIRFALLDIRVGRLRAPGDPLEHISRFVAERLEREDVSERARFVLDLLTGDGALAQPLTLADDRRVAVRELRLRRGAMDVTAVTLPASRAELPREP